MYVDILKRFLFGNIIVSAEENILMKHSTIKGKFREADMVERLEEICWNGNTVHAYFAVSVTRNRFYQKC